MLSITEDIAKHTNEVVYPSKDYPQWSKEEKATLNRNYARFIQKTGEAAIKLGLDMNVIAQAKALEYLDGYDWRFIENNLPNTTTDRKNANRQLIDMIQNAELPMLKNLSAPRLEGYEKWSDEIVAKAVIRGTNYLTQQIVNQNERTGIYVPLEIRQFTEYLSNVVDKLNVEYERNEQREQRQEKSVAKEQDEDVGFSREQQNKIGAVTNLAIETCKMVNQNRPFDYDNAAVYQPVIDIAEQVILNEGYTSHVPHIDIEANKVIATTEPTKEAKAHLINTLKQQAAERVEMAKTHTTFTPNPTVAKAIELCKEIASAHDDNTFVINEISGIGFNIIQPITTMAEITTNALGNSIKPAIKPETLLNERKQELEDRDAPKSIALYDYLTETYPHQKWDKNTVELVEYWAKESGGLDMDTKKQLDELHPAEIAEVAENMIKEEMDGLELEEEGQESYRGYTLKELNKRLETIQKFAEDNIVIKMNEWLEQEQAKNTSQIDTTQSVVEEKILNNTLYNYLTERYPAEKWDKKAVNIIEYWAKQDGEYDMSTYDALDKLHPSALIAAASEALSLQRDGLNSENEKSFMGYTLKELNERTKIVEKFAEDHAVIPESTIPKQEDNAHIYASFITALKEEQHKTANKGIAINDIAKKVMPRFPLTEQIRIGKVLTDKGVRNEATMAQILTKDVGRMEKKRKREKEREM